MWTDMPSSESEAMETRARRARLDAPTLWVCSAFSESTALCTPVGALSGARRIFDADVATLSSLTRRLTAVSREVGTAERGGERITLSSAGV